MEFQLKLKMPLPQNFIIFEMPPGQRQDGIKELPGIDIVQLSEEQAEQYAEELKQHFLAHYRKRKKENR